MKRSGLSAIGRIIKLGLSMMIPILFIGSMTVLINGIPLQAYQDFLDTFMGGALRSIILLIQVTTVGILAVFMTVALNQSFVICIGEGDRFAFRFGSLLSCITGFFILVGFFTGEKDLSLLSGQGVFSALLSGLIGTFLYQKFEAVFKTRKSVYMDATDSVFNAALSIVRPFLLVTLCFAAVNYLITVCFNVDSAQHLFMKAVDALFIKMQRSYSSGLLFTMLISTMWWFGIHGNNVLNQVAEDMFSAIIPGQIVSKSFIDTFVIMGGTGCLIGLLIAMILFGKRSSTKKLTRMALLPCMFNISELLVFGFPVIYNPFMIVPFILAPVLCFSSAYFLTAAGFLPEVSSSVIWTTPPLLSGYLATGSVRGILAQILNILISTACYAPFVIMYEKKALDEFSAAMDELLRVRKAWAGRSGFLLTECEGAAGRLARVLVTDLQDALSESSSDSTLYIDFEKRYDENDVGSVAAAHLKWDHLRYGAVDPALAFDLAKESGDLFDLETFVIRMSVKELERFKEEYGPGFRIRVSISASTARDKRFLPFLQSEAEQYMLRAGNMELFLDAERDEFSDEELSALSDNIKFWGYTVERNGGR